MNPAATLEPNIIFFFPPQNLQLTDFNFWEAEGSSIVETKYSLKKKNTCFQKSEHCSSIAKKRKGKKKIHPTQTQQLWGQAQGINKVIFKPLFSQNWLPSWSLLVIEYSHAEIPVVSHNKVAQFTAMQPADIHFKNF